MWVFCLRGVRVVAAYVRLLVFKCFYFGSSTRSESSSGAEWADSLEKLVSLLVFSIHSSPDVQRAHAPWVCLFSSVTTVPRATVTRMHLFSVLMQSLSSQEEEVTGWLQRNSVCTRVSAINTGSIRAMHTNDFKHSLSPTGKNRYKDQSAMKKNSDLLSD